MPNTDEQNLEVLYVARDNLVQQLALLSAKPKPNYNIDGQEILWGDYWKQLNDAMARLDEQIASYEGPYEEETIGFT